MLWDSPFLTITLLDNYNTYINVQNIKNSAF